jgi:DNA-binding transcriptional LysR family regulator
MGEWDGLLEFVEAVRTGGFSAAGRRLNRSTSHVSRQVAALERRLGTRLLVRSTRSLTLTEPGRQIFERAVLILNELVDLYAEVTAADHDLRGVVRITTVAGYAARRLAKPLAAFRALHPQVDLQLHLTDAVLDLDREGLDLAVRFGPLSTTVRCLQALPPAEVLLCASPSYLERHGTPEKASDLAAHACLMSPLVPWRLKGPEPIAPRPKSVITASDVPVLVQLAAAGGGIAYLPDFYVDDLLVESALVRILPALSPEPLEVAVVQPAHRRAPLRVQRLAEFLAAATDPKDEAPQLLRPPEPCQ